MLKLVTARRPGMQHLNCRNITIGKHTYQLPRLALELCDALTLPAGAAVDSGLLASHPVIAVARGTIGLHHILKDGRRTISCFFLAGDIIDWRVLNCRSGELQCLTGVAAHAFTPDAFDKFKRENRAAGTAIAQLNLLHAGRATGHCVDLARKSAVEKLASFIFECRRRQPAGPGSVVKLLLRRTDIADYMGLRPETLCRAFARLKQLRLIRLIRLEGSDLAEILNEPELRQLANGAAITKSHGHRQE